MSRILIEISCAAGDAEAIVAALRTVSPEPIHVADDKVQGRDFSDARTSEQVSGLLDRRRVSLSADEADLDRLIAVAAQAGRRQPMRWRAMPLIGEGRIA